MKTLAFLATVILLGLPVAAQESANAEAATTPTAAQAARAAQRQLDAQRRAQQALEGKPLVYSGFLTDLRTPEKKTKVFSLRQPADPRNDYKNVYVDERTARPKGFVLFRVGF